MSLLSRAVTNGRALLRSTPPQFGDSSIPPNSMAGAVGGNVSRVSGALAISTVLNCLRVLHDDFTTLQFAAMEGVKNGVRVKTRKQPLIVTEPFGPDLDPSSGFGQIIVSVRATGNAFLWVTARDRQGYPTQVQVMADPDRIRPERDSSTGRKQYRVGGKTYTTDEIRHVTGMMLPGAMGGIDPLSFQRIVNQLALDISEYAGNFFKNGTSTSGVLQMEGAGDKEKAREIAEIWEASHAGVNNSHRPGVLFNGKFVPTMIAPENAQFLQTRAFLREEIAGWYGVPLERIQASGPERVPAAGEGVETIDDDYAKHTLLPLAIAVESVFDRMLPGGEGTWTEFGFEGLLRPSPLRRSQIAQVHRVIAVRSPNEIRADEGLPPYDGGDNYNAPLNSNTSGAPAGNHNDPSVNKGQDGQDTPGVTSGGGS